MAFDFPSSPTVGQVSNGYMWNGFAWVGNGNLAAVAPPSDTPPGNPVNGQLWWETDSGDLFVWYVDANTGQWVQISGPGLGDAPDDGNMYMRQSGAWVRANDAGEIASFAMMSPPTGWLKANGAAVNLSVYTRLINVYCGDANNPTAAWGYRCTNPANPTGSRSVSGGYIVLPDGRGEFMRGFDDGRGADAGRNFWAWQDHMFQTHRHNIAGTSNLASSAGSVTYYRPGSDNFASGALDPSTGNFGPETRPRNIAALVCIRY